MGNQVPCGRCGSDAHPTQEVTGDRWRVWLCPDCAKPMSSLTPELFTPVQVEFLRALGLRVEAYTNRDGTANQSVFNTAADVAQGKLRHLRAAIAELLREKE